MQHSEEVTRKVSREILGALSSFKSVTSSVPVGAKSRFSNIDCENTGCYKRRNVELEKQIAAAKK